MIRGSAKGSIPQQAQAVVHCYLQLIDAALPGQLEGLYLVGSIALGDFQPGSSDVDFVAVTRPTFDAGEVDRLDEVHRTLGTEMPGLWFDGVYVTWRDLERNPEGVGRVPSTLHGKLDRSGGFEANPSTWLTLRNYPRPVRGPTAPSLWYDADDIRRWNVENLNSYWQGLVSRGRSAAGSAAVLASGRTLDDAIAWCVPGVARLHYTITTGDVTSKSGACRYALAAFPESWHPIISEALALRQGQPRRRRNRVARWHDVLGFMQHVIDDANTLYGAHRGNLPAHLVPER